MWNAPTGVMRVERGFPLSDVPRIWAWTETFRNRVADDWSPKTLEEFIGQWESEAARGRQAWSVFCDEELGGVILSSRLSPVVADAHAIFKKQFWGRATTLPVLEMVFAELFAEDADKPPEQQLRKISSLVFRDNAAMIALAKSLRFEIEGTLLGHTLRSGSPIDMVVLSLQREDFYAGINDRIKRADRVLQQQPGK
jgi:RimJ/RimL family protein N-acetyltransferase